MNLVTAKIGVLHNSGLLLLCDRQGHLERISELFRAHTEKKTLYACTMAVLFLPVQPTQTKTTVESIFFSFV